MMIREPSRRSERTAPNDRYADYCLWDYRPVAPTAGKLRSSNLLWRAIECAGGGPALIAACEALREGLGPFQTVYGVKKIGDRLSFEFYFYDYASPRAARVDDPGASTSCRPSSSVRSRLRRGGRISWSRSTSTRRSRAGGNLWKSSTSTLAIPAAPFRPASAYEQTAAGFRLANFYFFFEARKEMDDIIAKVACSAHHDLKGFSPASVLRRDILDCAVVVVANKKFNDGVYFSRLAVGPVIDFLKAERFPLDLVRFARAVTAASSITAIRHRIRLCARRRRREGDEERVLWPDLNFGGARGSLSIAADTQTPNRGSFSRFDHRGLCLDDDGVPLQSPMRALHDRGHDGSPGAGIGRPVRSSCSRKTTEHAAMEGPDPDRIGNHAAP